MLHAAFMTPALAVFCGLDELGPGAVLQLLVNDEMISSRLV